MIAALAVPSLPEDFETLPGEVLGEENPKPLGKRSI